ncbi:MAG: hypothetical protein NVS9B4_05290 [Candidatus Acidiferrum sp.]
MPENSPDFGWQAALGEQIPSRKSVYRMWRYTIQWAGYSLVNNLQVASEVQYVNLIFDFGG